MKIKHNKLIKKDLNTFIDELVAAQEKNLEVIFSEKEYSQPFSDYSETLFRLLDHELFFGVWLINIPFCVLSANCYDHIFFKDNYKGEKIGECLECSKNSICKGFPAGYFKIHGNSELNPVPDLPIEVMLEVEARCNFKCGFCYNHRSFAKSDRNTKKLSYEYWHSVIRNVAESNIGTIRFTGGEPLLRSDIFRLMGYAKDWGLEVRLNTNCSLVSGENIQEFRGVLDNVLIPIESNDPDYESDLTGFADSLTKKIEAIKMFSEIDVPVIRIGTVLSAHFFENIKEISDMILALPIHEWEFYRPVSHKHGEQFDKKSLEKIVDHILAAREYTDKKLSIANAVPFCALPDLNLLNSVSQGAVFEDGHSRMVVDPRGFVKPHYFMDENVGDPKDLLGAWNSAFMKQMRQLAFLPLECQACSFRSKCRGGSRFEAELSTGLKSGKDPLANFDNISND